MAELLWGKDSPLPSPNEFVSNFTRAVDALLRAAHGKESCSYHIKLLQRMGSDDAIVTFNYDLVAERAIKKLQDVSTFGPWIYCFELRPGDAIRVPTIYKLHGSVNWRPQERNHEFSVRQKSWKDFDQGPGYRAHSTSNSTSADENPFPILLPYWDKKVERRPWNSIWRSAAAALARTTKLIIWGYSLPLTDLKAYELFRLSLLSHDSPLEDICIIDPSKDVRTRWRSLFLRQKFWPYENIKSFQESPPSWW